VEETVSPAKPLRGTLLSIKETAGRLGLSQSRIYSWRAKGLLPFDFLQPSPGRYFCDSADVDDYLSSVRRQGINDIRR
jgi:DNA-binding transcriptional MerR regulator